MQTCTLPACSGQLRNKLQACASTEDLIAFLVKHGGLTEDEAHQLLFNFYEETEEQFRLAEQPTCWPEHVL